jgi:hypothetical protein
MKNFNRTFWLRIIIIAIVVTLGASVGFAQKKPTLKTKTSRTKVAPKPAKYAVKAGAKFRVRMNEQISSKTARVGDTFTVTVVDPVYSEGGEMVIPSSSIITGQVTEVKQARKGGEPGMIDVTFTSVRLPNNKSYRINGTLTDLSAEAKSDDEGQVSGDKMKHRKIVFIGGGAGGGALLGAAIGGGKGAAIGAIIGGVGGLITERMKKGEEAVVKSGTEFGMYLNQTIYLPKYASASEGME